MRKAVVVVLILSWIAFVNADQISSIGFRDNKKLEELLKFRLPDWGYSSWSIDLSGDGHFTDQNDKNDQSGFEDDVSSSSNYIGLNPGYRYYRESDDRVFSAMINLRIFFDIMKERQDANGEKVQDGKSIDQSYNAYYRAEYSKYISDRQYLNFYLYQRGSYSDREHKESNTTIYKQYQFGVNNSIRLGYGFGRLRNVTPILNSMRFAERFQALGYDHSFSSDELQTMAMQFAKYSGYQSVHFRGSKYFWDDLFKGIPAIPQLKPFDYFYLADVLSEPLLNRFEGWKAEAGIQYSQYKISDDYNDREAGAYVRAEWSKNLDLEHQLSFDFNGVYSFLNKSKNEDFLDIKNSMMLDLHGAYLWVLSDRIVWNNGFYISYQQLKINTVEAGDFTEKQLRIDPGTTLTYYIEDRLNLSAMVQYNYSNYEEDFKTTKHHNFNYSLTLQYYFSHL
ncbi:MAG: hypothetical protein KBA26_05000 [Candidatus Delongbacteria bacterium]|nr:hypothetical protein [Candidatus Delongbacteria bacterium]